MRPSRRDLETVLVGQLHDRAAQAYQLGAHLGWRMADVGADLHDGLVQFGLDLLTEQHLALCEDLRDVRA
jgi:hypothetical protein